MGLVYSRPTWEKVRRPRIEARRARERSQRTDENAGLPGTSVNPGQGQGSHWLTGRWDSWGAQAWPALEEGSGWRAVRGPGGRPLRSSWEGFRTKGHVGVTSASAKAGIGLSLSHLPPTQRLPGVTCNTQELLGHRRRARWRCPQTHRPAVVTGKRVFP